MEGRTASSPLWGRCEAEGGIIADSDRPAQAREERVGQRRKSPPSLLAFVREAHAGFCSSVMDWSDVVVVFDSELWADGDGRTILRRG